MEPQNQNNPSSAPASAGHSFPTAKAVTLLIVLLIAIGFLYAYQKFANPSANNPQAVTQETEKVFSGVNDISDKIVVAENDPDVVHALTTFRDIAADESNTPVDRARALNAINYAYQSTDFDANTIYQVVFTTAPFSAYYTAGASASGADLLHPERTANTAAVEAALQKLTELSFSLAPTHYALVRQEIFNLFSYQREAATAPKAQQAAVTKKYADKILPLVQAYNALPPIQDDQSYRMPMRLQTMFGHAGVLSWLGTHNQGEQYRQQGEQLFKDTIALGDSYTKANSDKGQSHNMVLLARIFYVTYYWPQYKDKDPEYMKEVIRPLINDSQGTMVDQTYLSGHKDAKNVPPFSSLREVSKEMPELKTYLQSKGWVF